MTVRAANVRFGSWLCENAKRLKRDRISYSSKTALVVQHAIEFNLEVAPKNIILVAFRYFEFLHSQGQTRKYSLLADVFRCSPDSRHTAEESALPFCARTDSCSAANSISIRSPRRRVPAATAAQ